MEASAAAGGGRFLLAAARPLGEPIARYGPFVMNTRAEIEQTLEDLRTGRFIREEPGRPLGPQPGRGLGLPGPGTRVALARTPGTRPDGADRPPPPLRLARDPEAGFSGAPRVEEQTLAAFGVRPLLGEAMERDERGESALRQRAAAARAASSAAA